MVKKRKNTKRNKRSNAQVSGQNRNSRTQSNSVIQRYQIGVGLPKLTAFNTHTVTLNPLNFTGSSASVIATIYQKYKIRKIGFTYVPSCGISSSAGAFGIIYNPEENTSAPATYQDTVNNVREGTGVIIPVKASRSWNVPRSVIKNYLEGYDPTKTATPGAVIIATAAAADIDAPGILSIDIEYLFYGRKPPVTTTPDSGQEVVGGYTLDLTDVSGFPDGYAPVGAWAYLPGMIKSCYPPSSVQTESFYTIYVKSSFLDGDFVSFGFAQGTQPLIQALMQNMCVQVGMEVKLDNINYLFTLPLLEVSAQPIVGKLKALPGRERTNFNVVQPAGEVFDTDVKQPVSVVQAEGEVFETDVKQPVSVVQADGAVFATDVAQPVRIEQEPGTTFDTNATVTGQPIRVTGITAVDATIKIYRGQVDYYFGMQVLSALGFLSGYSWVSLLGVPSGDRAPISSKVFELQGSNFIIRMKFGITYEVGNDAVLAVYIFTDQPMATVPEGELYTVKQIADDAGFGWTMLQSGAVTAFPCQETVTYVEPLVEVKSMPKWVQMELRAANVAADQVQMPWHLQPDGGSEPIVSVHA